LRAGFSLENGPLFKTALCRMPDADYVLLTAHHLVVDAVSWRILLEDLSDAYRQALERRPVSLAPKTSSYAEWANALAAWCRSESITREKVYWSAVEAERLEPVPTDFPAQLHHYGQTEVLTVEVPAPREGGVGEAGVQAVLLTALARTLRKWTGRECARVLLAGHGRISLEKDVDVSRTVGWFTANYPVLISTAGAADVASQLAATRRMLASVPSQGAGYGILKYLTPAYGESGLAPAGEPEIGLNYLGHIDEKAAGTFTVSDRLPGASAGTLERAQKLEIDAMLAVSRLVVSVRYCPMLHRRATVEKICGWLREELTLAWPAAMAGCPGRLEMRER
jgi:non-ribosomal peptide synthase protein (TIGR01720 family)